MSLLIAAVALLGFVSAAHAQDRRFSALAEFAAGPHPEHVPDRAAQTPLRDDSVRTDGFTGSFSARETAQNLGY